MWGSEKRRQEKEARIQERTKRLEAMTADECEAKAMELYATAVDRVEQDDFISIGDIAVNAGRFSQANFLLNLAAHKRHQTSAQE